MGWVPDFLTGSNEHLNVQDFWTINIGILSVQGTLVGLVFPLVIAFVGLLNQGRASFASRLTVYIESSTAIFVGVSSLLLCVAIVLQLSFVSKLGRSEAFVTLLNISWFSINASALAYFVLHTIAFLHPTRRASIMRSYVSNIVWPRELSDIVTLNRWVNAERYGYLPKGDDSDPFSRNDRVRTWYTPLWDGGEILVSRDFHRKMRLTDVRFGVIQPIVQTWLEEARALDNGQTHDFVIPIIPGCDYFGEHALIRTTLPLTRVARWGVRTAFKFEKAPDVDGVIRETTSILREMLADLIVLIDTRQVHEFSDQLSEVIEFHAFLYRLAQLQDEDINYAQFESSLTLSHLSLGDEWMRAYRDLIRRAIERLAHEPEYTSQITFLAANIYGRVSGVVTPKAVQPVLSLARLVAYRLMDWAIAEYTVESNSKASTKGAFTLSRLEQPYAGAWRDLVAGWERLLQNIISTPVRSERRLRSWNNLKRNSENIAEHLNTTTLTMARAVWLGDTLATSWMCDLILKWRSQLDSALDARGYAWKVKSEALTLGDLEHDWNSIQELSLSEFEDELTPSEVFGSIMSNAWYDHVVVAAGVCTHWAMNKDAAATAKQAAQMLLHGKYHDRGDAGHGVTALSGIDILTSALRISGSGERFADTSYAGQIDHLLEALGGFEDPPMVSMRSYSSSGGLSFETLTGALAIMIMATMSGEAAINSELRRLLTRANDEALRRQERFLKSLIAVFERLDPERHEPLLATLSQSIEEHLFEHRRALAKGFVELALSETERHREVAILEAEIDPNRLDKIATAASSEAFIHSAFPLHLCENITATTDELNSFRFRLTGVSKGDYTTPPMSQPVTNETEWWQNIMSKKVAEVVWHDVIKTTNFHNLEGLTPEEFWQALLAGSAKMKDAGLTPILIINEFDAPAWLDDWRWPHRKNGIPKPSNLVVSRDEKGLDAYLFTMNDIPVYSAQTDKGFTYLIPKELIVRLRYHDYGNGLSVSIEFEPDADDHWKGAMSATFQRAVEISKSTSYRIRWASPIPSSNNGGERRS
ncbi:hypothetical protein SADFL11_2029 [Roseibium alexandrii DFL-11]|uniref:Uncharacterized protein n=2 Tax=Roseibium alexandrii TaxID=388408 RepID=A0A5E8GZ38_ROSAD|nr:hypothetical protein SADFL11_2029 [Roseibium alexandrii DFL-11]